MVSTRQMRKRMSGEDGDVEGSSTHTSSTVSAPKRQRKLPVRGKDSGRPNSSGNSSNVIETKAKSTLEDVSDGTDNHETQVLARAEKRQPDLEAKGASGDTESEQADVSEKEPSDAGIEVEVDEDFSSESSANAKRLVASPSISEPSADENRSSNSLSEAEATKSSGPARDQNSEDGESDSDDAPEVVSTSKAAAQALQSAKAANRAITECVRYPIPVLTDGSNL